MSGESRALVLVPAVVSSKYASPIPSVINTLKPTWTYRWNGKFAVEDEQRRSLLTARKQGCSYRSILIKDAEELPLILLRKSFFRIGIKWKAYRGSESDPDSLLFTCMKMNRSTYHVYLAANISKEIPDFTIRKNAWYSHNFKVFYGDQIIAETTREGFKFIGKRKVFTSVHPQVDKAFIASLLALMEEQMEEIARQVRPARK